MYYLHIIFTMNYMNYPYNIIKFKLREKMKINIIMNNFKINYYYIQKYDLIEISFSHLQKSCKAQAQL